MRRRRTAPALPAIEGSESFDSLVKKLSVYFVHAIETPHDWEELRRDVYATSLRPLVRYLVDEVQHQAIVSALLALKWHFDELEEGDDRGINATRGLSCELVAWRFITHLTHRETIEYLCTDLPGTGLDSAQTNGDIEAADDEFLEEAENERAPLLDTPSPRLEDSFYDESPRLPTDTFQSDFSSTFAGLNALEIAAVSDAKKFLRQKTIQHIIDGIWKGDIVFWETLSTHSCKEAKVYRPKVADPYCRLRVPLYLKVFEVLFFAGFLTFYYVVLVQKHTSDVTAAEVMLYIWLASFTYNEFVEYCDAGSTFYATDFWSLWDLGIIFVGVAFFVARMIGLQGHPHATDVAFDILSLEALFLIPRICSLLSLHPYFGMLLPVLKAMASTIDFVKFLSLVAILYVGFSTCFSFLARGQYTFGHINWILIKVFFGSSYLGFDTAEQISPVLGVAIMLVFCALTSFLLQGAMISILSNTLDRVMEHAKDEYLYTYSVYVLEASTSNRLTYFYPVLNLLPLMLRPLRLVFSAQHVRKMRIVLLKATHAPLVACILGYERALRILDRRGAGSFRISNRLSLQSSTSLRRPLCRKRLPAERRLPFDREARETRGVLAPKQQPASESPEGLKAAIANLQAQVEIWSDLLEDGTPAERA
ncbi:uncharacterized protein MYCFIDRAFT_58413 [Pseudocercospora fijiensis CIRAD86]|uniref:Calcium channel YVC1-like C-terminal transmembrane domain-containing protein n=1 Tax=Pseudocercospora fijiensis (strain CIRAD86) TaxID=383855 RepID=M2YKK8_PSEFD|nr:uncharacterized protein MYCFIDRAFT_58413 [Pseudocercospora fijiensis CIRAD86]EME78250.1 hypothetical protein MYCFIDRAFT_58413 [Pseudocercospora fijiensis CIRAD86]